MNLDEVIGDILIRIGNILSEKRKQMSSEPTSKERFGEMYMNETEKDYPKPFDLGNIKDEGINLDDKIDTENKNSNYIYLKPKIEDNVILQEIEKLKKDKEYLEKEKEELEKERGHLFSQQAQLRSAFDEAKRKGI